MPATDLLPRARSRDLVVHDNNDEVLIYDTADHKAHCLNGTSAFVWTACDGSRTIEDIATLAAAHFGSPVGADLIELALAQLGESELLESPVTVSNVNGRREWIKRVGMTSLIALPVIASLVAPPNALASASCACVNPGGCLAQTTCPNPTNCNGAGICAP